jgi:hypothetical protein
MDKKTTIYGFQFELVIHYHNILIFVNKKNQYIVCFLFNIKELDIIL